MNRFIYSITTVETATHPGGGSQTVGRDAYSCPDPIRREGHPAANMRLLLLRLPHPLTDIGIIGISMGLVILIGIVISFE